MATGRKTVVVGQVIDPAVWGNPLWDQSVQTFASDAARTAQFPAPLQGATTWLDDVKKLQVFNGTRWVDIGAPMWVGATTSVSVPASATASASATFPTGWFRVPPVVVAMTNTSQCFVVGPLVAQSTTLVTVTLRNIGTGVVPNAQATVFAMEPSATS